MYDTKSRRVRILRSFYLVIVRWCLIEVRMRPLVKALALSSAPGSRHFSEKEHRHESFGKKACLVAGEDCGARALFVPREGDLVGRLQVKAGTTWYRLVKVCCINIL